MERYVALRANRDSDVEPLSIGSDREGWPPVPDNIGHRISALTAQLLRAENQEVIDLVATELQESIRRYVETLRIQMADSGPLLSTVPL